MCNFVADKLSQDNNLSQDDRSSTTRIRNCWRYNLSQLTRLWYLSHRRPAKAQASLRIRAVSPEPSLFAHMRYGSRRRVRPKPHWMAAQARLKNEFTEDEKCHNFISRFNHDRSITTTDTYYRVKLLNTGLQVVCFPSKMS